MTHNPLPVHETEFRSAIDTGNFLAAERALEAYLACFQSSPRNLSEIEDARRLLNWAIEASTQHKAQIGEDLRLLKTICEAYLPRSSSHTWRVDA